MFKTKHYCISVLASLTYHFQLFEIGEHSIRAHMLLSKKEGKPLPPRATSVVGGRGKRANGNISDNLANTNYVRPTRPILEHFNFSLHTEQVRITFVSSTKMPTFPTLGAFFGDICCCSLREERLMVASPNLPYRLF